MPQLRKMYITSGKPLPHVGSKLAQLLKEKKRTKAWICKELNVNGAAATEYIGQQSMHAALMWKLGQVLEFDFFAWLSEEFPLHSPSEKEHELRQQVADLKKENEIYQKILMRKLGSK